MPTATGTRGDVAQHKSVTRRIGAIGLRTVRVSPPPLRTASGHDLDERRASWLELFFDLVLPSRKLSRCSRAARVATAIAALGLVFMGAIVLPVYLVPALTVVLAAGLAAEFHPGCAAAIRTALSRWYAPARHQSG